MSAASVLWAIQLTIFGLTSAEKEETLVVAVDENSIVGTNDADGKVKWNGGYTSTHTPDEKAQQLNAQKLIENLIAAYAHCLGLQSIANSPAPPLCLGKTESFDSFSHPKGGLLKGIEAVNANLFPLGLLSQGASRGVDGCFQRFVLVY